MSSWLSLITNGWMYPRQEVTRVLVTQGPLDTDLEGGSDVLSAFVDDVGEIAAEVVGIEPLAAQIDAEESLAVEVSQPDEIRATVEITDLDVDLEC